MPFIPVKNKDIPQKNDMAQNNKAIIVLNLTPKAASARTAAPPRIPASVNTAPMAEAQ